ncbi:hypothetical protein CDG81_14580 [Actinopolyspora erythraea]|uniref:PE domain-containing protein n=1 Tax=Actinopolyspora erythraea TaxID=414996 RepID=A0A099D5R5_9ACTN|nr:hypothetical protein [Actinopolyspora erythraea]ASU79313.1 hypothetical protein CDG81_14580 [Actinopolyspora erythraea]KGI80700.1 hypothetical protein IL38_15190 [Actinopolyspora erythraea]
MADEAAGFAGASAALGVIREENSWIQQRISAGQLAMEPQAADSAAAVYEREASEADQLADSAIRLQQVPGLGDYLSGQQLANKFGQKASNGSTGAADLLRQFADELRRKAALFREAKQRYVATDEQISGDLKRGVQQ